MKILFHNYSDKFSTEPLYLHQSLAKCGIESSLWMNPNESAYDAFDKSKPDIFVTHLKNLTNDIVQYLRENQKIDLVLNTTGATDAQVKELENFSKENKIKIPFVFFNSFEQEKSKGSELTQHRILPAFDLFNIRNRTFNNKNCKLAILMKEADEELEKIKKKEEVYHLVQVTDGEKDQEFDLRTNATSIPLLYDVYDSFRLVGDIELCSSQLFFDLNFNVDVLTIEPSDRKRFEKFLIEIFEDTGSKQDVKKEIKSQLKARHTPFHRASIFCKHLGAKDERAKVEKFKGQLPQILDNL